MEKPQLLLNANIMTMDPERPRAEALALSQGRILYVGSEAGARRFASRSSKVLDLGGRTVLPGFIDCHTHFLSMGVWKNRLDLVGCRSPEELLKSVATRAKRLPWGKWLLGRGWDEAAWNDGRYLDRRELDSAAWGHPVMLIRVCGHMAALNTKALRLLAGRLGSKGVDPATGLITEGALEKARRFLRPSEEEMAAGLELSLGLAKKEGVTSVHDIIDFEKFGAYRRALRQGILTVRACIHFERPEFLKAQRLGFRSGWGDPLLRIGGMKLYADGSFGARTAALRAPYSDIGTGRGELLHSSATLRATVRHAERSGTQLLIHAIGDQATSEAISAFSSSLGSPTGLRHRIEHLELVDRGCLKRMRKLGLWACMQPNFVGQWGAPGGMMEARLGKQRYRRADPFKAVIRAGVPLVFGSDCMPFSPLYGIASAVNARFPDQRLTVEEAVAAYTRTAAAASFEEDLKGTLTAQKAADMVVLSGDPFRRPSEIEKIRVEATILAGRLVWGDPGWSRPSYRR